MHQYVQYDAKGESTYYSVAKANAYFDKNMLLLKNLQFSPNHYETLTHCIHTICMVKMSLLGSLRA